MVNIFKRKTCLHTAVEVVKWRWEFPNALPHTENSMVRCRIKCKECGKTNTIKINCIEMQRKFYGIE